MRKMKAAHLPHSEVRVALRQFPVAGAELPDVVMTENIRTLSCMLTSLV